MAHRFTLVASVTVCLAFAPVVLSQAPSQGTLPARLEEMLDVALRSNPGILEAEARAQEAQARLNQARLKAKWNVTAAYHELVKLRELLALRELEAAELRTLSDHGRASSLEHKRAVGSVTEIRAQVAQAEARLRYLLGTGGAPGRSEGASAPPAEAPRRPEIPKKMRELLEKKVTLKLGRGAGGDLQTFLKESLGGTVLMELAELRKQERPETFEEFHLEDVPLRSALLSIADVAGVCFVFREYGVLVTSREAAARYHAPTIPTDFPTGR